MDQVDSLNEIMTSALQDTPISGGGDVTTAVMSAASPVIAVAADLPSFQYFISEQAKSMLALQELQNEVGALLEFRDLVMEAFPQLGQKLQTFSNALQSQTALSPSKWEPGIRVKRKLGQQLRGDADMLVPSLLPRYRSNSQGKTSRSSEVSGSATSSAIQDSGFCTESNKDHSSAISSRSKSRETDDELSSLLDHIHNKGTRLKLEVEYLWSRLNRKNGSSLSGTNKRRCKSLDDLILTNGTHSFTFECAVKTAFLETELSGLKRERDMLLKKMNDIESEHLANLAQTNRLLVELETISAEKRDLEERLQVAVHSESEINNRINDLHNNFLARSQWRNVQTPLAKGQLLNLKQVFKDTNQKASQDAAHFFNSKNAIMPSASTSKDDYYTPEHSQEPKDLSYSAESSRIDRPANPVTKELNANSYQAESHKHRANKDCGSHESATRVATLTKDEGAADCRLGGGGSVSVGKPDILIGFFSGHSSSIEPAKEGGVTLSREKVLSILNEYDPMELRRFLLTLSYQIEALEAHMQRVSKSRLTIFQQLSRYKIENEDLRFQLEEKNIQLEGTKAKVRVLERMRNEKLSYSTSDLATAMPKTTPDTRTDSTQFTCPVSDTALLIEKTATAMSNHISAKCMDLRDPSDRTKSGGTCRRSVSKIPLKTKLPTKLSSSGRKTLTSFKEYSASGPSHSSCISYTPSSLSNK